MEKNSFLNGSRMRSVSTFMLKTKRKRQGAGLYYLHKLQKRRGDQRSPLKALAVAARLTLRYYESLVNAD